MSEARPSLMREEPERRLVIPEAEGTDDPTRLDLPALDYALLAALTVPTSVTIHVWGH